MAHGLDHLDRDQLVVTAAKVAVVLVEQGDAVAEARRIDALARDRVLLARDRRGRHVASVAAGRMNREAAPAGADLDHAIARLQIEPAADAVELGDRRLLERHVRALEHRARIHHRRVEEQREEVVADVVVRADVAPAAVTGVARGRVERLAHALGHARPAPVHAVDDVAVVQEDAHERRRVVGPPVARHVRLAGPDGATERGLGIETRVAHVQRCPQRTSLARAAERVAPIAVDDGDLAVLELSKLRSQQALAPPCKRRRQ